MNSVTVTAKTIEKAIEEGLELLNISFEDADIKVVSEGGFFKKAVVEISVSADVQKEKEEKINKLEKAHETKKPAVVTPAPVSETEKVEEPEMASELKTIEQELAQFEPASTEKVDYVKQTSEEIEKFLNGLLYSYNIIAKVETSYKGGDYYVSIVGENLGVLIGYHGEALDAIQFLLTNYINNKFNLSHKIILDVENYRLKRAESLQNMATTLAGRVVETKRSLKLEPMNSFERKTIHTHLQGMEHIGTHSEGVEPNRYLVIDYVE
jgi:spoIIIJ-associated protein